MSRAIETGRVHRVGGTCEKDDKDYEETRWRR